MNKHDNYYVLNDLNGYGSAKPICVTYEKASWLMVEWYPDLLFIPENAPDFDDIWHVASADEIREYGFMED